MAILNRFTRLFKADVHAMLDQLEEPEALLRQALREMEEEVRKNALKVKGLEQQSAQSKARVAELGEIITGIGAQLDLCFAAGNTELAKNLLRRRLENQRLIDYLQKQHSQQSAELNRVKQIAQAQSQKLETLRQQAAVYDLRQKASAPADFQRKDVLGADACLMVSDQEVEIALLEEKKRRSM